MISDLLTDWLIGESAGNFPNLPFNVIGNHEAGRTLEDIIQSILENDPK